MPNILSFGCEIWRIGDWDFILHSPLTFNKLVLELEDLVFIITIKENIFAIYIVL